MADAGDKSVPMVRPERPLHVAAFELFTQGKSDQIEAFVAFGMFIASEYRWASSLGGWPGSEQQKEYYGVLLLDSEVAKTEFLAKKVVEDHREKLVTDHQKKYLDQVLATIFEEAHRQAKKPRKRFVIGVLEAFTGAFFWTLALIVFSAIAHLAGIDVIEVFKRIAGS